MNKKRKLNEDVTTFGNLSRSQLMSRIKSKNNKSTEIRLVKLLRRNKLNGWRRHLNLPGKPDFAWPKCKLAVFIDGCFWHGHNCGRNLTPKTNTLYWRNKIQNNKRRDRRESRKIRNMGWKVIRIWECILKNNPENCMRRIKRMLVK